ncbi:hypothetical protein GCM10018781_45220 [Kitasatospora indigofera]|uniref:Uncharacterized protein n=1 Tax=Kitasatospora indigofera TaxID=67307 RepID=A0A919G013_9ACTN|nr:hypothetical protein GCM10018781_45220 [Kitasatospora indigofera]
MATAGRTRGEAAGTEAARSTHGDRKGVTGDGQAGRPAGEPLPRPMGAVTGIRQRPAGPVAEDRADGPEG